MELLSKKEQEKDLENSQPIHSEKKEKVRSGQLWGQDKWPFGKEMVRSSSSTEARRCHSGQRKYDHKGNSKTIRAATPITGHSNSPRAPRKEHSPAYTLIVAP